MGTHYIPPGTDTVLCDLGALGGTSSKLRPPGVLRYKKGTRFPQLHQALPQHQPGVATFSGM